MLHIPLGYLSARKVLELGRTAFFGRPEDDLPVAESAQIAADDLLPQFGYVGKNYGTRRILLLAINPGNGPRRERSAGDRVAMPALFRFATERTPESFEAAQAAYRSVCEGWAVWGRQCQELLDAGGVDTDEIAFTNALPWRTKSQSRFAKAVARQAAELYAKSITQELEPRIIIAVGKRAAEILEYANLMSPAVVVWNRAQALTPQVAAERKLAAEKFAGLLRLE